VAGIGENGTNLVRHELVSGTNWCQMFSGNPTRATQKDLTRIFYGFSPAHACLCSSLRQKVRFAWEVDAFIWEGRVVFGVSNTDPLLRSLYDPKLPEGAEE
jgi:hypothetical protein